ncbi:MAG: TRAP transporter large permease subunit [Pseudomonadota bacterium]
MVEALPVMMLVCLALLLFSGLPVAIVLAGLGITFSLLGVALGEMPLLALYNVPIKMWGSISQGLTYAAVVMLLFMGVALEKSGVARDLLTCMQLVFRRVPGGLGLAVIVMGVVLAPAAGLVGASVVTLALIAMPSLLSNGYRPEYASGAIAAAGTVGVILPPAVMLFFLASQFQLTIGAMFLATVIPGGLLVAAYALYFVGAGWLRPPSKRAEDVMTPSTPVGWVQLLSRGLVAPLALVGLVLASITFGWATPRQSAAVGAAGGLVLVALNGRLNWAMFVDIVRSTALLCAMVFFIIIAAAVFSYPFVYFGGNDLITSALDSLETGPWGKLAVILGIIFVLGFFIDWIEITIIFLPLFLPTLSTLEFAGHVAFGNDATMLWMATLVALTLQTSFVTPPFGFALFFLKGASPEGVTLPHIYRGIIPVVALQVVVITLLLALPMLAVELPARVFGE